MQSSPTTRVISSASISRTSAIAYLMLSPLPRSVFARALLPTAPRR